MAPVIDVSLLGLGVRVFRAVGDVVIDVSPSIRGIPQAPLRGSAAAAG